MAASAIQRLLDRINGDAPPHGRVVIADPKLITRASTVGYAASERRGIGDGFELCPTATF
jgi:hypothetical protein